jgi:Tfp pilus assembly protein PilZ
MPQTAPTAHAERRAHRYDLGGAVELTDFESGQMIVALARALSSYGCFIRTEKSFPLGAKLKLNFVHLGSSFSEAGRVVNRVTSKDNAGIGVEFIEVDDANRARFQERVKSQSSCKREKR